MTTPSPRTTDLRVALFATCFNDTMWPETPKATVRLLERLGCRVEFPLEQTCCGQMLTNTGYAAEALPLVRRFVDVFGDYDAVVSPSGSCVGSVREQHPIIASSGGTRACWIASSGWDRRSTSCRSSSSTCSV